MTWIQRYEYVKKHWPLAGWFLAVLFGYGYVTKKPEPLTMPAPLVVNQAQAVTQTAKATVQVKLVYRDRIVEVPGEAPRSLPCPDVEIQADSGTEATHWQSQAVTSSPKAAQDAPRNVLFAGIGYLEGPTASAGYGYGPWRASAQAGFGRIGGGLTLDVVKW